MAEVTPTKYSHVKYLMLTVSGVFQHGWVAGAEGWQYGGLNFLKRKV